MSKLNEQVKTKKNSKVTLGHIIAFVVIVVLVLVFIISSLHLSSNRNRITTELTMLNTQKKTVSVDLFIVRNEQILTSSDDNIVSAVNDGARVSARDVVAYSFSDSASALNVKRLAEVTQELEYYVSLDKKSSYITDNTSTYDNKIMSSIAALSDASASGDFSDIGKLKSDLRDNITSKQTATGVELDLSEKISTLTAEKSKLEATTGKYKQIFSGGIGYYISGVDGYENTLDYASVDDWTIEQVESAMSASASAVSSDQFGRLVNSYYWYLVCVVDTDSINSLRENRSYTIGFYDSSVNEIESTVYRISSDPVSGKSLVVFSCNTMSEELASLRHEYSYVVLEEAKGYKIDNRAFRSDNDNNSGVYVLDGHTLRFRTIDKIVYSNDEYSLAKSSQLNNYDEYVVTGQDLYENKVIK